MSNAALQTCSNKSHFAKARCRLARSFMQSAISSRNFATTFPRSAISSHTLATSFLLSEISSRTLATTFLLSEIPSRRFASPYLPSEISSRRFARASQLSYKSCRNVAARNLHCRFVPARLQEGFHAVRSHRTQFRSALNNLSTESTEISIVIHMNLSVFLSLPSQCVLYIRNWEGRDKNLIRNK